MSSWKIRNVLSSRICALWENRHTANNSYLAMQTHCKTERSKGCKRLRVLIVVPVLQMGSCLLKHTVSRRLSHTSCNLVRRSRSNPQAALIENICMVCQCRGAIVLAYAPITPRFLKGPTRKKRLVRLA